jgi:ABC-type protease/lipase transport system fused ATPase/permease subunit
MVAKPINNSRQTEAEGRDRIIPIVLDKFDLPLRIDFRVTLDCTNSSNWKGAVRRLRQLLEQPEQEPARVPCPYPGMVPFGENDSGKFYGRDTERKDLLERLRLHPFLAVIGPSGSGKSSLVFAGLISRPENDRAVHSQRRVAGSRFSPWRGSLLGGTVGRAR